MENYCTSSPLMPRGARSAQHGLLPSLRYRTRRRGLHSGDLPHRQAQGRAGARRIPYEARILDIYDAMQQAMETGTPYHTRLDPPPAHGWTPPESPLEAVAQPLLHFKDTE